MQFIVIGRDGTDPEAPARRAAARPAHISMGDRYRAEGKHLLGVALLDGDGSPMDGSKTTGSNKMVGSVMLVDFPGRAELDAWLAEEPYVIGKVWEQIEVTRCQVGPSFADLFARW